MKRKQHEKVRWLYLIPIEKITLISLVLGFIAYGFAFNWK